MIAIVLLALFQEGATYQNYARIELGMTRDQVAKIVRQAPATKITDFDRYSVFSSATSRSMRLEGELWRSGKTKLWLKFDKDNRLTGKMLNHDEEDEIAERLKKAESTQFENLLRAVKD
jgi:outer membrane protein assembly factor BamE (lipoprotein component of BamABCDE complex)